ncbi:MAG TPA: hypothetical protein VFP87_10445 [Chitinophagaceae bacterium]|nr:hypothetical protein [Chitinophagaceae bacterium]
MKKIFVILLSMAIVVGASAQKHIGGHYYRYYRPRTSIVVSGGYYPYYPMSYNYGYWGAPYYYDRVPSKLALEIEDIQSDYKDRIWSVRHDDQLSKKERRQQVRELKSERDRAIRDAERNYYRSY